MPDLQPPTITGASLLMAGATIFAGTIGREVADIRSIGIILIMAGMLIILGHNIIRVVREVNRPADQAYLDGYEDGYDKGWLEGQAAATPALTLVPRIERRRTAEQ